MDNSHKPHILIIYTGGTIGMIENPETGALENFDFEQFRHYVPEMRRFNYKIDALAFNPPIDSSDMEPRYWVKIAHIIADHYEKYDGFVLLHGTDTMAYTASALSFMLENLGKPVIITGSQLPIGQLRTDGKENLLTSIEIAAATDGEGNPRVPEVCSCVATVLPKSTPRGSMPSVRSTSTRWHTQVFTLNTTTTSFAARQMVRPSNRTFCSTTMS